MPQHGDVTREILRRHFLALGEIGSGKSASVVLPVVRAIVQAPPDRVSASLVIGALADSEFIYIFGLPFRRSEDSRATSGTGVVVWGGGEYQHPLSERLRLRAGTDLVRREYGGSDFDRTTAAVHLGPRWLVDRNTETSLLGTAQQSWTAGEVQNSAVGVRLESTRSVSRWFRAFGQISWQHRDFRSSEHLDGPLLGIFGRGIWTASPTVRVDLGAGYSRERTASEVWRNTTI